ncbi:MipA/OmpV family protein [Aquibium carbonis]|uniref:MipA/OmpV family protein n=1 Tax=Aquibium carbonis TaxID=2495581 RepID=A0A3R9YTW5_9HYPH|nr:MipA/OmpV family protein [Aquibium carbonis]RST87011.1 MipA/OmpV family protein [Aquibium carbonis]
MPRTILAVLPALLIAATAVPAQAENWFSGDWYLKVGAAGFVAPNFKGDDDYRFRGQPLISFGRQGSSTPFSSRNDNISIGILDQGYFRAGPTGKLVFGRDSDDSGDLVGLDPVRFGGELGVFAEFYPVDWLRLRGEVRHGIRSHDGIVGDLSADAFTDVTPTIRISGGPRASFATNDYFDAWYGVSASEALASGLSAYDPDGGVESVGIGGAITWKATDTIETSLFGEYSRLMGSAADSSLVRQRGSVDQFLVGVSATYRFDFSM